MDQFFYSTEIFDDFIVLPKEEAHHAIKVLRKKNGDQIFIVDGFGSKYKAEFENESLKNCKLKIIKKYESYGGSKLNIHIAISPPKSHDRLEWFIEKSVEIGISEISLIQTANSERKQVKYHRIRKYAISAMKQSLKAYLPIINEMKTIESFLPECKNKQKFIAHLNESKMNDLYNCVSEKSDCCILIGPEGDFNSFELNNANEHGFKTVTLGTSRLRTETAGLVACHIINLANQK